MLNKNDIKWLEAEFGGPVNWIDGAPIGFPASWKGWLYATITPLPSVEERKKVAADISHEREVRIVGGKLKHYRLCTADTHFITGVDHTGKVANCLNTIPNTSYHIAIYSNVDNNCFKDYFTDQPLVVAFDPPIDYVHYPEHLHINTGGFIKNGYIPDSLCYLDNFSGLLALPLRERLLETLFEISMWLFRHQIWEKSGEWIGPHKPALGPEVLCRHLNPYGECRCGSGNKYLNCCMPYDTAALSTLFPVIDLRSNPKLLQKELVHSWKLKVGFRQNRAIELLKKTFLV